MPQDLVGKFRERDWAIDLVPKFMMASGELVDILVATNVTRYLEFTQVAGSYVYKTGSGIAKVPATPIEALASPLMGFFEKRRAKSFFEYTAAVDPAQPSTWAGKPLDKIPFAKLAKDGFGLEDGTIDFLGHALALHYHDSYLAEKALPTVDRIRLYMSSMLRFGKSPFIYPLYGLAELPQAFARLCAIYGGTQILNCTQYSSIIYGDDGRVAGVQFEDGKKALAPAVFCDPSYAMEKVRLTHQVIRCICLLENAIPSTSDADSCQIILPQRQLKRMKYDVYVACVSSAHKVCPPGYWLASLSTISETINSSQASPEGELKTAMSLLGPIKDSFMLIQPYYEPMVDGTQNKLFISKSYDATSHFETVSDDVKDLYKRYSGGKALEVQKRPLES